MPRVLTNRKGARPALSGHGGGGPVTAAAMAAGASWRRDNTGACGARLGALCGIPVTGDHQEWSESENKV